MNNEILTRQQLEKKIKRRELGLKLLSLFAILVLIAGLGVFIYFQTSDEARRQLADPTNVKVEQYGDNYILTFDEVSNASAYRYTINGVEQQVGVNTRTIDITQYVQIALNTFSVQAIGDNGYKNSNIVYGDEFAVYKSLDQPIVQIDQYDSKLVWIQVDDADGYEVTVIADNDISNARTIRVAATEFDISDIIVDFTKEYSFTVLALSDNTYINQSVQSVAVNQKLEGRFDVPESVIYDELSATLYWQPVDNAETYTVVLKHGTNQEERYITSTNRYTFSAGAIEEIGTYSTYVYANNVQGTSSSGETILFLASEESEEVVFSIYQELATPTELQYQINDTLVWLYWDAVPNAKTYVVELLNESGDKYLEYTTTGANNINIERSVIASLGNVIRAHVKANGYGYYTTSDFSDILEVDISDQFAPVSDIEVIENGNYLTFTASSTNVSGSINVFANGGYYVKISNSDGVIYEGTIYSTTLDTSSIFTDAIGYSIEITVNAYGYFEASTTSTASYAHQIFLNAPYNVYFESNQSTLNVYFNSDRIVDDLTVNIGGDVYECILSGGEDGVSHGDKVTYSQDSETGIYTYVLNFTEFYKTYYEADPLTLAQRFSIKIKAIGDVTESDSTTAGYKNSPYSSIATYENRITLDTPQFIKVENLGDENCILYFTQVENATSYLIEITSANNETTYRMTSRLTTVNIYDVISAGYNYISITAQGTGYYSNSVPSDVNEYFYTVVLKAPNDVQVVEDGTNFYVQFTTTRFADGYQIQIMQTQEVSGTDDDKSVTIIEDAEFEILDEIFSVGEGITRCDITDYLSDKSFGRFEIQVRSLLNQTDVEEQPIVYSDWSDTAYYNYYDKQSAPANLAFDYDTNTLTFDAVSTANNGYIVRVNYALTDGTYSSHEYTVYSTTVDLTEEIQSRGGIGEFVINVMTLRVDSLFLRNSDWSDSEVVEITYTLSNPTNFVINETTSDVSWTSDINMQYEYLKIEFSNNSVTNLTLVEINDQSFKTSIYNIRSLLRQYGDGFYTFSIQSHSNQNLVYSSELVQWTYTKYLQLNSPVLVEVTERNGRVETTFTTVENASSYAIVAKLSTQGSSEWNYILQGIEDDGSDSITIDIKQSLISFLGANDYDIAVVAEAYDYFSESDRSNVLQYDLWLTFSAPSKLEVTNEDGTYYATWDQIARAVSYTLTVNSKLVSSSIESNKYDLTEIIGDSITGHYLIAVRTNATGNYYQSVYTTYDFYLTSALQTPELEYDEDTYTLKINGQGDGMGYHIIINYYDSEAAYDNGVITSTSEVSKFTGTQVVLKNHMSITGLGIYIIIVQELGDGIYWQDSEWSENCKACFTTPASALTMFNIDKRDNEGTFEYYVVITKDTSDIYANALVEYTFYEVDSIDATLSGDETPKLTIYSQETEFLINGLEEAKYYVVKARVLGGDGNKSVYTQYLDSSILSQTLSDLEFYTNSAEKLVNFSTLGNLLGAPIITSVTMLDDEKLLQIQFNKSLNAEDYTLIVTRESESQEIYNGIISDTNADSSITVTIPTIIDGFTDIYDVYNIIIYANDVINESGDIVYGQSPNTEFNFEYITTLGTPTVHIERQVSGELRIYVDTIESATGYTFEISINYLVQEYTVGDSGYILFANAQYGRYVARAKALGDAYHNDSEYGAWGDEFNYMFELGGVEEVRIVANSEDASLVTRIYAEWDAVDSATKYGVKILKDGTEIGEYDTNKTYYDVLNLFSANGYGVYRIYVKTNDDGYIQGEDDYSVYVSYTYKTQSAIPSSLAISMEEEPSDLIYTVSFDVVTGAATYRLTFYAQQENEDGTYSSYELTLSSGSLTIANNKASADISNFLDTLEGGEYLVTIKVDETSRSLASEESEAIEFTNYHKHADPSIQIRQMGTRPVLRISFSDVDYAIGYQLSINGVPYLIDDDETFTYPQVGYLDIYAGYLNIGGNNVFTLTILGDSTYYYLDTIYEKESGPFTFQLTQVDNIFIEQTSYTIIPDGESSILWLTFNEVDFADSYELWVDGVYVQDLEYGQDQYDISSVFSGRMPKDDYTVSLVATDSVYGLVRSSATDYTFDYTLRFTAPTNLELTESSSSMNLTFNIPDNYESYMSLMANNNVTIDDLQEYEIRIYYTSSSEEKTVIESLITTSRVANYLEDYLSEPGGYRIEVYTCAYGAFDASIVCATYTYDKTIVLDAVQNVSIYKDGDSVRLSFDKVDKKDYQYADQDIYYYVYLNGELIFSISHSLSTNGIVITSYLWGGENAIYIITKDRDSTHFLDSEKAYAEEIYEYDKSFLALENVTVYNDEDAGKQYLRFSKFSVNGLSDEEILSLTYTVTIYDYLAGELVSVDAEMLASVYDKTTLQIDITDFINDKPGTYKVSIKVNAYSTQKATDAGTIAFEMGESDESETIYQHQLRAEVLELSLLVIDTEGNARSDTSGLEMQEMWLSFDVNFRQDYLESADSLMYTLSINDAEYYITIPFSLGYIGETVIAEGHLINSVLTVAYFTTEVQITSYSVGDDEIVTLSISIIPLLEANGFNIYMTGIISIKAKSQEQGFYLASNYQSNFLVYTYRLRYLTPTGLELVQIDGLYYIKWDEPIHPHVNNYYSLIEEYNVTIYSQGIIDSSGQVTDPHGTKNGSHSITFTPNDIKSSEDDIIFEVGYLYYCVDSSVFAGHNSISLKCNGDEARLYYDSEEITITKQPVIKKLESPEFEVENLEINDYGKDSATKGVEITIVNYSEADYDEELGEILNYNSLAQYRLIITSQSQCLSDISNPTEASYMTYFIDFIVNRNKVVEIISGSEYLLSKSITFKTSGACYGELHIVWQFAEPGEYTYQVQAVGVDEYYTSDSDFSEQTFVTTYNAPQLKLTLTSSREANGDFTKITGIVLTWQTQLSYFYGHSYTIVIQGSFDGGNYYKAIQVDNATTITFNSAENSETFEEISKRPAYYTFLVYSNAMEALPYEGASESEKMYYYKASSSPGTAYCTYQLQINTPDSTSIYETGGKEYIKTKIPEYLIDAGIEAKTEQIFTTYTITQQNTTYNLGNNTAKQSNSSSTAGVLWYTEVTDGEEGYYYIDITGLLYPGENTISFSFNDIAGQYFVGSEQVEFNYSYVWTLESIESVEIENIYNENHYVTGFLISFNNVQYNKYFSYLIEIKGTKYNASFSKTLLLQASTFTDGSSLNYKNVQCYDVTDGTKEKVVLTNIYTRNQSGTTYTYTKYTYTSAQNASDWTNLMTFAILIDGGIPDEYLYSITSLGELVDQNGELVQNTYISDIVKGNATKNSKPFSSTYTLKGTLRKAEIAVGLMDDDEFTSATTNTATNYLAYIYNSDDASQSVVYYEYGSVKNETGEAQENSNIHLQITLQDTQALTYSLSVKNMKWDTGFTSYTILEYDADNGEYKPAQGLDDIVKIGKDGAWYVDLMSLDDDGIFTEIGKYQICVTAHNDDKVNGAHIYESVDVDSANRYVGRFDKVPTPKVEYNKDNNYFYIENFSEISATITHNGMQQLSFTLYIQYKIGDGDASFSDNEPISIVVNNGKIPDIAADYNVSIEGNCLKIPDDYLKYVLDGLRTELGKTYIRVYFDVDEKSSFIWDSEYSNGDQSFAYKAYLTFPYFWNDEKIYSNDDNDVYCEQGFKTSGSDARELATSVQIKYFMSTTKYVEEKSNWTIIIGVTLNNESDESDEIDWEISNFNSYETYSALSYDTTTKSYSGFLAKAIEKAGNIGVGEYTLSMRIKSVKDSNKKDIDPSLVEYDDETTYQRNFIVKAKFLAPIEVTLTQSNNDTIISQGYITLNTSSDTYLKQEINKENVQFVVEVTYPSGSSTATKTYTGSCRQFKQTLLMSSLGISFTYQYSGEYSVSVYIDYIGTSDLYEDSPLCANKTYDIPYTLMFNEVTLTVDASYEGEEVKFNQVTLGVDLRRALCSDSSGGYSGGSLTDVASNITYDLDLICLSNGDDVTGNSKALTITNSTLANINKTLTEAFGNLVANLNSKSKSFLPGSYVVKIKTNKYESKNIEYIESSYFYANQKKCYHEEVVNTNISNKKALNTVDNGFKCKYTVGYQDWDPGNITYVRDADEKAYYGYVTDAQLNSLITDGAGKLIPFVEYQFAYNLYSTRSGGTAVAAKEDGEFETLSYSASHLKDHEIDIGIDTIDFETTYSKFAVTYASTSDTESTQGIGIYLRVSLNDNSILEACRGYIALANDNEYAYYSGVTEDGGVAQYEALCQRLSTPSVSYVDSYHEALAWWGDYCDYTITWTGTDDDVSKSYTVEGWQKYSTGDGALSIVYSLIGVGNFEYVGTDGTLLHLNFDETTTSNKYSFRHDCHLFGWDYERLDTGIVEYLVGGDLICVNTRAWRFRVTAISGSPEYADSATGYAYTSSW